MVSYAEDPEAWRAEKDARIDALNTALAETVQGIADGKGFKEALVFSTRFPTRSFENTIRLFLQYRQLAVEGLVPEGGPMLVAGPAQWRRLGRFIKPGQKAMYVLAPVKRRQVTFTPDDPTSWEFLPKGEQARPGQFTRDKAVAWHDAAVFDVSQTRGRDLPSLPQPQLLTGEAPEGLWDGLTAHIRDLGFELHRVPDSRPMGGANGLTDFIGRTVSVRTDMDDAAQVRTLSHEAGHATMHDITRDEDVIRHRGIIEVEAEGFALVLGATHGLDTAPYTIPYVAGWASTVKGKEPGEVVRDTAERVRKAASAVLAKLDTVQISNGEPPGLDAVRAEQKQSPSRRRDRRGPTRPKAASR